MVNQRISSYSTICRLDPGDGLSSSKNPKSFTGSGSGEKLSATEVMRNFTQESLDLADRITFSAKENVTVQYSPDLRDGHIPSKSSTGYRIGYKKLSIPEAEEFFKQEFPALVDRTTLSERENKNIQTLLLSIFLREAKSNEDRVESAKAGLLLRGYLSHIILNTCKNLASKIATRTRIHITYLDLLPFVLNDDGKSFILLNKSQKLQVRLTRKGEVQSTDYKGTSQFWTLGILKGFTTFALLFLWVKILREWAKYKVFSVEIIRTFDPSKGNLENWAIQKTLQNPELAQFLKELGHTPLTDWTLLNQKTIPIAVKLLLQPNDELIIEAFHEIYRSDRKELSLTGKCKPPSEGPGGQLEKMRQWLKLRGIYNIQSDADLKARLEGIAAKLRQKIEYESIEITNSESEIYAHPGLPVLSSLDPEDIEFQEVGQLYTKKHQKKCIYNAIAQEIPHRIEDLKNSKRLASYASLYLEAYRLLYFEGLSITQIAAQLLKVNQVKASRILAPLDLVKQVCHHTVTQLLQISGEIGERYALAQISNDPEALIKRYEAIKDDVDKDFGLKAIAELQAGKNRQLNSLYAEQMRRYLNNVNKEKQNG